MRWLALTTYVAAVGTAGCASAPPYVYPTSPVVAEQPSKIDLEVHLALLDEFIAPTIMCSVSDVDLTQSMMDGAERASCSAFARVHSARGFRAAAPETTAVLTPRVTQCAIEDTGFNEGAIVLAVEWQLSDPSGRPIWKSEVSARKRSAIGNRFARPQKLQELSSTVVAELFERSAVALATANPVREFASGAARPERADAGRLEGTKPVASLRSVSLRADGETMVRAGGAYVASVEATAAIIDALRTSGLFDAVLPLGVVTREPDAIQLDLVLDVREDRHGIGSMAHAALVGFVSLGMATEEASRKYYSLDAAVRLTATRSDGTQREWEARSGVDASSTSGISAAQTEARRQQSGAVLEQLLGRVRADANFLMGG